jgi:hypothetical protein
LVDFPLSAGSQLPQWHPGAAGNDTDTMDPPELEDLPSSVTSRLLIVPPSALLPAAAAAPTADDFPALAEEMQKAALAAQRDVVAARSAANLEAAGAGIGSDAPGSVMGKGFLMRAAQTTRKGAEPSGPSAEELRGMSAKQLKALLDARGVRHAHCVEKGELLELALSAPAAPAAAPAVAPAAAPAAPLSSTARGPVDLRVVGGGGGSGSSSGGSGSRAAAPVLPDVQKAMAAGAPAMAAKLKSGSWMTPELMSRIAADPRLLAGMQQPRFMAALTEMQKDPAGTLKRHEGDAALLDFLRAFMGVLGDHFQKLGEAEDAAKRAEGGGGSGGGDGGIGLTPASSTTQRKAPAAKVGASGAVAAEAPSAEAIAAAVAAGRAGVVDDPEVKKALSNTEVVALLTDEELKRVLQECQRDGAMLDKYMALPRVRQKLLRMQELGLIRLQ